MQRTLTWRDRVRAIGTRIEARHSVPEYDAGAWHRHQAAEATAVCLRQRDHIALAIGGANVDGADGGIRHPGDVAKALAAGAHTVMIGSMLAGTDESPGMIMTRRGHRYKASRGMASLEANIERNKREGNDLTHEEIEDYVAEGVEAAVPYRGRAREVLTQLVGGLQSGMSYSGAHSVEELQQKAIFVRMTGAGLKESGPHDVEVIG